MPRTLTDTYVFSVMATDLKNLPKSFVAFDTAHETGSYDLPKGKVIVVGLFTQGLVWTTIRRWTPEDESYYTSLIGKKVDIELNLD